MAIITVRQALNDAFKEEMKIDPTIIMMGCDIGVRGGPFGITLDLMNLYGKDRANNMFLLWASQNPDLAHNTGRITDDQFNNIKAGKSMNDGLDENGKRIIPAVAAAAVSGGGNGGGGWDPGNHYAVSKINYNRNTGSGYYSDSQIASSPGYDYIANKYGK